MNILKVWDNINDLLGRTPLHPQFFIFKYQNIVTQITLKDVRGDLIDIGCGRQLFKEFIGERRNMSYTSLDHPNVYKRQRSLIKPDILADIEKLPIKNSTYQSALLLMVLAHLPKPWIGIKEVYRILKRNGRIYVSSIENYPAHDLPNDYFRYRISGIEELCINAGFKIVQKYSFGNMWQVNAINFNMLLLQTAKYVWDKKHNWTLTFLLFAIMYPLTFLSNILAILLGPLDFIQNSKLINFVIAQK